MPEAQRNARRAVYKALAVAAQLLHLRNTHEAGFDSPDMTEMYKDYESRLFRFDQLYRHFCENADVAAGQGWDMLKPLREEIEACYCNGYLTPIALAWGKFVDAELPGRWAIDDVQNQYRFFAQHVGPWLSEADNRRAFVIISDAMRYEAAEELTGSSEWHLPGPSQVVVPVGCFAFLYRPGHGEPPAALETRIYGGGRHLGRRDADGHLSNSATRS